MNNLKFQLPVSKILNYCSSPMKMISVVLRILVGHSIDTISS